MVQLPSARTNQHFVILRAGLFCYRFSQFLHVRSQLGILNFKVIDLQPHNIL